MQEEIQSVWICLFAGCVDDGCPLPHLCFAFHLCVTPLPSLFHSVSIPPFSLFKVTHYCFPPTGIVCTLLFFSVGGPCEALECKCLFCCLIHFQWDHPFRGFRGQIFFLLVARALCHTLWVGVFKGSIAPCGPIVGAEGTCMLLLLF